MPRKTHQFEGEVTEVTTFDNPKAPVKVEIAGDADGGFEQSRTFKAWPTVGPKDNKRDNPAIPLFKEGAQVRVTYYNQKDKDGNWECWTEEAEALGSSPQNGSSGAEKPQEATESNIRSIPPDGVVDGLLEAISASVINYFAEVEAGGGVTPSAPAVSPILIKLEEAGISRSLIQEKASALGIPTKVEELSDVQLTAIASTVGAKV